MKRFIEGVDRGQGTLFPERLEDWVGEENPVRVIDVFVDELDLQALGGRIHSNTCAPRAWSTRSTAWPHTARTRACWRAARVWCR